MDLQLVCPVCNNTYNEIRNYCSECGCDLSEIEAVTVTINPNTDKDRIIRDLKSQVQKLGKKAQSGLSGASNIIAEKASTVALRTSNVAVEEKVSEAMSNLVNMMINVSKDVKDGVPSDMVNAIDLSARVNFVAFSIGVSVDLAALTKDKKRQ